jgi:heme A synthase
LVLAQLALGIWTVLSHVGAGVATLHLVAGMLLFSTLVLASVLAGPLGAQAVAPELHVLRRAA